MSEEVIAINYTLSVVNCDENIIENWAERHFLDSSRARARGQPQQFAVGPQSRFSHPSLQKCNWFPCCTITVLCQGLAWGSWRGLWRWFCGAYTNNWLVSFEYWVRGISAFSKGRSGAWLLVQRCHRSERDIVQGSQALCVSLWYICASLRHCSGGDK